MKPPQAFDQHYSLDTSRLRQLEAIARRGSSADPPGAASLCQRLLLRLQTSLETDRLLEMFLDTTREPLSLCGLDYRHAATDRRVRLGEESRHGVHYRLHHEGEPLGELLVWFAQAPREETPEALETTLSCLLFPLRNALLYHSALLDALRDPLTGAGNRVAMNQALPREIELARRHGQPLSLLMLDLDHFKRINDRHGHQCGDAALQAVANLLKSQLRTVDMMFRFGGEEFLILLSSTDTDGAATLGRRLQKGVENLSFQADGEPVALSVSQGCATYRAPESCNEWLSRADKALYQAKRSGRNQLCLAV